MVRQSYLNLGDLPILLGIGNQSGGFCRQSSLAFAIGCVVRDERGERIVPPGHSVSAKGRTGASDNKRSRTNRMEMIAAVAESRQNARRMRNRVIGATRIAATLINFAANRLSFVACKIPATTRRKSGWR